MKPLQFLFTHVLGLSYAEIGRRLDVTRGCVAKWASGERAMPMENGARLEAIAHEVGVPFEYEWLFRLPACPDCPTLSESADGGTVCPGGCARLVARCAAIREGGGGDHGGGLAACPVMVTGNGGSGVPVTSDRQEAA